MQKWRRKARKARTIATFNKTSWVDVADHHSQNGSCRPTLRKQYHMCKLIYEVLTLGPERISILLGKCFPLGSVSATAYRCFSHAENTRLFPPRHEWKSMLKVLPQPSSESDLQLILRCTLLSTTFCTVQGFIWHRHYLVLLTWTPVHIVQHRFVRLATFQWQMHWQQCSKTRT